MTLENQRRSSSKQLARCPTHEIYYDRLVELECPRCEQERESGRPSWRISRTESAIQERSRPIVSISLLVVAVALAVFYLNQPGSSPANVRNGGSIGDPVALLRIDPQRYRERIEALESVLYDPEPSASVASDAVSAAALALADDIMADQGGLRGQVLAKQLMAYGMHLSAEADMGYTVAELRARERWEQVRGRVFSSADWFQASSAEPTTAQTPPTP